MAGVRSRRIWFVPTNTSHVGKFSGLMVALREAGAQVGFLCVDSVLPPGMRALPQVRKSGFPFEQLPATAVNAHAHWLLQVVQRPRLERALKGVLATIRADAIILGFDGDLIGRSMATTARRAGIPIVLIPDGLVVPENPRYRPSLFLRIKRSVRTGLRALLRAGGVRGTSGVNLVLVMNEMGRDTMIGQGVAPDRICAVGSPEYDFLAAAMRDFRADEAIAAIRTRLGIDAQRPVVFFAHQTLDGGERVLIRTIIETARMNGAVALIKFHPRSRESPSDWVTWAARCGFGKQEAVFVREECTSVEAVQACSVCVTVYSTIALEAMICGRPLVLVQYANVPYALPYGERYGAAMDAQSPGELQEAVQRILNRPEVGAQLVRRAREAVAVELCGLDERSQVRMVDAIAQTITGRPGCST
jgi:hypothetical protein